MAKPNPFDRGKKAVAAKGPKGSVVAGKKPGKPPFVAAAPADEAPPAFKKGGAVKKK